MVSRIFISHSGDDSIVAMEVARALEAAGLCALLDRDRIQAGDSFIAFMEDELSMSDSCLLLWSESASRTRLGPSRMGGRAAPNYPRCAGFPGRRTPRRTSATDTPFTASVRGTASPDHPRNR